MHDKHALQLIGFVAASITCAIVLVAIMVVHKTVAGELWFHGTRPAVYGNICVITGPCS